MDDWSSFSSRLISSGPIPVKSNVLDRNSFLADSSSLSPSSFCTTGTMASSPCGMGLEASTPLLEMMKLCVVSLPTSRTSVGVFDFSKVRQSTRAPRVATLPNSRRSGKIPALSRDSCEATMSSFGAPQKMTSFWTALLRS
jgi:hypothetical protein